MKMIKKVSNGVAFARKAEYEYEGEKYEADIKNGDKITILDSGTERDTEWGIKQTFVVKTRNGDKSLDFNQKSINCLIDSYGEESNDWIGKEVNVYLHKGMFGGKKGIATYVVPNGWVLDEYGDLSKSLDGVDPISEAMDDIDVNDIPFD